MTPRDDEGRIRYLLDEMSEAERDAFEDEYIADEAAYGQLEAMEGELIDLYCEGALSTARRQRFEEMYLRTAERRQRVAFAQALKRLSGPASAAPADGRRVASRSVPWAVAAATLLVTSTVLGVLLARRTIELREATAHRRSQGDAPAARQERSTEQERRLADVTAELAAARQQARLLEDLLGPAAASAGTGSVSLELKGGLYRDRGTMPRIGLSRDVAIVRLLLPLPPGSDPPFRAALQTPEGRELWAREGARADTGDGPPHVTFLIPAVVLAPGHYVVVLSGAHRAPDDEPDAEYAFEVRRQGSRDPSPPSAHRP